MAGKKNETRRTLGLGDLPRSGLTEEQALSKAQQLRERGRMLIEGTGVLQQTMIEIGVVTETHLTGQSIEKDSSAPFSTMDGLFDLLSRVQSVNNCVEIFVAGEESDQHECGSDCDSKADPDRSEPAAVGTEFGRRVLVKSNEIQRLLGNIKINLGRIEKSLLPQEGPTGPKGEKGSSGSVDYSTFELILNLEENAHEVEMCIASLNARLRNTY